MIAMLKAKSISKAKEINIGSIGVMLETFSSIPFCIGRTKHRNYVN